MRPLGDMQGGILQLDRPPFEIINRQIIMPRQHPKGAEFVRPEGRQGNAFADKIANAANAAILARDQLKIIVIKMGDQCDLADRRVSA